VICHGTSLSPADYTNVLLWTPNAHSKTTIRQALSLLEQGELCDLHTAGTFGAMVASSSGETLVGRLGMRSFCAVLLCTLAGTVAATEVLVPAGTTVYAELQQRLTSKKGIHRVGDPARATVWRDVVVNGQVVIPQGTPVVVKIKSVKPKRLTGRRGSIELEAVSVNGTDGSQLTLDGGYDASGNQRVALASSLASALSWSVTVIKGKEAVLPPGTLFDAQIKLSTGVESSRPGPPPQATRNNFDVAVLYDSIVDKEDHLPLEITRCGIVIGNATVVTVNDEALAEPITVEILNSQIAGDCVQYRARVELKRLGRQLGVGINRFEIESQSERAEVILAVEL